MKVLRIAVLCAAACNASPLVSNAPGTATGSRIPKTLQLAGHPASGATWTGSGSFAQAFASVRDYGAAGDGVTDDSGAVQAAADAVASAHGGTIFFPPGRYRIATQINYIRNGDDDHDVHFVGVGGSSALLLDAPSVVAFYIGNVGLVTFEKLTFLPYSYGSVNVEYAILVSSAWRAAVRDCDFFGLRASQSVIYVDTAGMQIDNCGFRGSMASFGVVSVRRYRNIRISDSQFTDYGLYAGGYYSQTGASSWINIGDPTIGVPAQDDSVADFNVLIERTGFDEGAFTAVHIDSGDAMVHPKVTLVDCNHLIGVGDSYWVRNVDRLELVRCGWRARTQPHNALTLTGVRQLVIDRGDVNADATSAARVVADAGSEIIKISDMAGSPLVLSTAPTTRVIYDQAGLRSLAPFTTASRPSAAGLAAGAAIWNSDTAQPNYADGAGNWVSITTTTGNWTFSGNDASLSAPGMMGFKNFSAYDGPPSAVPASPWIGAVLLNGWANVGGAYSTAGFFKDISGTVHLRGAIRHGISARVPVFQLPPGFRPATTLLLGGGYRSGGRPAGVQVDPTGDVAFLTDGRTELESVDGISFLAEQ